MRIDEVQTIKDRLTMTDVATHYGYKPNRAKFICCPFHNEKTPSMKIFDKDYHCFGCGANGDVITFVQQLFSLTFPDALKKIDLDFGLNLYGEHSLDEIRRSHYRQKQIQAERERKEREKQQSENEYWAVFDEWVRLDRNKTLYAPKTPDEEWNPLFVEALQKLAYQEYLLDCAEERRYKN
jgi:DNA primase